MVDHCSYRKPTSYTQIKEAFKKASEGSYAGVISYTEDSVVSQDYVSDPHTCNFDAGAGMALNYNFVDCVVRQRIRLLRKIGRIGTIRRKALIG